MYMGDRKVKDGESEETTGMPILIMKDHETGLIRGNVVPHKGVDKHAQEIWEKTYNQLGVQ